ncbi:MAG: hypothetical protein MZV70_42075 [Desulfobacterales bacterium]|nr:hypothetical protein [Desulfobacterales bacterium]
MDHSTIGTHNSLIESPDSLIETYDSVIGTHREINGTHPDSTGKEKRTRTRREKETGAGDSPKNGSSEYLGFIKNDISKPDETFLFFS